MAEAERREVRSTRVEYALRTPTAVSEVAKTIAMCLQEYDNGWDDAWKVETRDDEIVFWREVPEG